MDPNRFKYGVFKPCPSTLQLYTVLYLVVAVGVTDAWDGVSSEQVMERNGEEGQVAQERVILTV